MTIINLLVGHNTDIINTTIQISLHQAIETLNKTKHNNFDSWYYDNNLNLVIVNKKGIELNNSFYYTLTEKEAILIASHYQE